MYAPILGPQKDIVIAILKSAEKHPEIQQNDIQVLLWTIIARARFADYSGQVKATAVTLLTPMQLTQLEGGMLGVLPKSLMEKAKSKLPATVQDAFEAENNIRKMVASGNSSFAEMEKSEDIERRARRSQRDAERKRLQKQADQDGRDRVPRHVPEPDTNSETLYGRRRASRRYATS